MAFLVWIFSSELMARKIFSWVVSYLVRPKSDYVVESYKILQSKHWSLSKKESESFIRMKDELKHACFEFKEGRVLRSKTHTETYIIPKPRIGQNPNKRVFTSLAGLQLEGGGMISSVVLRLAQTISQMFGMGGVKGLRTRYQGRELDALRKDQKKMRFLTPEEEKEFNSLDTEEMFNVNG
jgi:hypothetical protein